MEEFAGMGRQGGNHLDDRGGFANGGVGTDDREKNFGQAEALAFDGEVGPTSDEVERGAEGTKGGFVDRLDGDDGPDADGKGRDVEEGEGFVGKEVAPPVGEEDAEGRRPVQGRQE
jgi:hypothetical protein